MKSGVVFLFLISSFGLCAMENGASPFRLPRPEGFNDVGNSRPARSLSQYHKYIKRVRKPVVGIDNQGSITPVGNCGSRESFAGRGCAYRNVEDFPDSDSDEERKTSNFSQE